MPAACPTLEAVLGAINVLVVPTSGLAEKAAGIAVLTQVGSWRKECIEFYLKSQKTESVICPWQTCLYLLLVRVAQRSTSFLNTPMTIDSDCCHDSFSYTHKLTILCCVQLKAADTHDLLQIATQLLTSGHPLEVQHQGYQILQQLVSGQVLNASVHLCCACRDHLAGLICHSLTV